MNNKNKVNELLNSIEEQLTSNKTIRLAAETARSYYKRRFREKEWNGTPWKKGEDKKTGSLLIKSSALLNSIQISKVTKDSATITAGNSKVAYAKIHNEGFKGRGMVKSHVRRTKNGKRSKVKSFSKKINMPKRQFIGTNKQLEEQIVARIENSIKL